MKGPLGERLLLVGLFGVLPAIFIFLVLLPSRQRMEARKARMEVISAKFKTLPAIQPLTGLERKVLGEPGAGWQTRIPALKGDAERFGHYHRVVSELQAALKKEGVPLLGVRASWDGLNGSYSLPGDLGNPKLGLPLQAGTVEGRLQGWVLDARVGGTPSQLIEAMEVLPRLGPFLDPVGLRWESTRERTRQSLLLRNLILAP